jgi:hypothetical protein
MTAVIGDCIGDCAADGVELHRHLIARCESKFRVFDVIFLLRVRPTASTVSHHIAAFANTIACVRLMLPLNAYSLAATTPFKHTPTYMLHRKFLILKQIFEGTVFGSRGYTTIN